jgi:hypothetical protein
MDCPAVWYLEAGYQTVPAPQKAALYGDFETEPFPVADGDGKGSERDAGRQLLDGVSLAYCQTGVGAFFNFLLADEPGLAGWQSGVLWADGTPKKAYQALRSVAHDVAADKIDCAAVEARSLKPDSATAGSTKTAGNAATRERALLQAAVRQAAAYATRTLHLRGLSNLRGHRSRLDPSWILVDGYNQTGKSPEPLAVWLAVAPAGPHAVKGAHGSAARRKHAGVPCDVSTAFARPFCPVDEMTGLAQHPSG